MKTRFTFRRWLKTVIFFLIMALVLLAGIKLRNFLLGQLQQRLSSVFSYSHVKVSLIPPGLVFENIRLVGETPSFTADRLLVRTKLLALFSRERPVTVFIDKPVIRYVPESWKKTGSSFFGIPPPFILEAAVLRQADVLIQTEDLSLQASGLQALWKQRGARLELQAESENGSLTLSGKEIITSARLRLWLEGRGPELRVRRFLMTGNDRYFQLKGKVTNISDPQVELNGNFWWPLSSLDSWLNLPFTWEGQLMSEGKLGRREGNWSYEGKVQAADLSLNGYFLSSGQGWISTTLGKRGDLRMQFGSVAEGGEFSVSWEKQMVAGKFARFHLDPVMKELRLPWPVKSPAWGNFRLANGELQVEGEFREKDFQTEASRYPFQGYFRVDWDGHNQVKLFSPELLSNFARFQAEGRINLSQNMEVQIKGEVVDIAETRAFLQTLLGKTWHFPEIKGQAETRVSLAGSLVSPEVAVEFEGSPISFGQFEVAAASGLFKIAASRFKGDFQFTDPEMTGKTELSVDSVGSLATFVLQMSEARRVLAGLGVRLPLSGKFSGQFQLKIQSNGSSFLEGHFLSPRLIFLDQIINDASGQITLSDKAFRLENFKGRLAKGPIEADLGFDLSWQNYSFQLSGQGLNLEELIPGLKGEAELELKGQGLLGQDKVRGKLKVKRFGFFWYKPNSLEGEAEVLIAPDGLSASLRGGAFEPEGQWEVSVETSFRRPDYSIKGQGKTNLLAVIPWKGTEGELNYLFEISRKQGQRTTTGVVEANGSLLPIPNFPHALNDFSLLAFIQDENFSVRSFQAKLGGGDLQGFGEIKRQPDGNLWLDLQLDGHDLVLSPLDRARFLTDGSLRLVRNAEKFSLEGVFEIKRAYWRREFFEKITFSSSGQETVIPSFLQGLTLSLRLKSADQVYVENSLARIRGRLDLMLTGEVNSPLLLGEIEALDGNIYFQDRTFRLLKGKLTLTNPLISAPYLEMKGETYVQDYRVNFSLVGPTDRLKPEFSSSPPLGPEEVLALLAFGESFKRITSTDIAAQVSTASFLSAEIVEAAKKRAQKILSLDRLRIDPFVLGSSAEMTARLTVGKKISENFFIIYSTNLTTQREEIVRLEWEIKPGLSIVGIRDELGRLSFDLKIRRRF